jgi:hypothetical protein
MPKFVIERSIPGAGAFTPTERQEIARKSCAVLMDMGPQIQWIETYVTENNFHCIYIAPNAEMIREHARRGGFPCEKVMEVRAIVDPTTAE